MKIMLLSLLLMMTSCKPYDPEACPKPQIVGSENIKDWSDAKKFIRAAFISCSFQKMCVATINFNDNQSTCKEQ